MNRQRLTALLMATAVLAGMAGLLNDGGARIMSRTWADGGPVATLSAKAHPGPAAKKDPSTTKQKGKDAGKRKKVSVHGSTWS